VYVRERGEGMVGEGEGRGVRVESDGEMGSRVGVGERGERRPRTRRLSDGSRWPSAVRRVVESKWSRDRGGGEEEGK
jgi:hypothetical protein